MDESTARLSMKIISQWMHSSKYSRIIKLEENRLPNRIFFQLKYTNMKIIFNLTLLVKVQSLLLSLSRDIWCRDAARGLTTLVGIVVGALKIQETVALSNTGWQRRVDVVVARALSKASFGGCFGGYHLTEDSQSDIKVRFFMVKKLIRRVD